MFDNIRADFRSHDSRWDAFGFWALVVYRYGRWRYNISPRWLRMPFSFAYHILFNMCRSFTGIELPCEVPVGRNLIIDHFGPIVVSGHAKIGDNCRLRPGVVIGLARVEDPCAPTIGNNVDIGVGAKLLGRITIGDNVCIGANAVVIRDVPSDSIAVGVPAVVRPAKEKSVV